MLLRQSQPTTLPKRHTIDKESAVIFGNIFPINVLHVIHFARSAHLDARPNQPRHETKCGDFGTYFLRQRIINRQERYSFRATSCTLRERDSILSRASWYTTKSITAWNKVRWFLRVFFQTTHYQPSRALFISCNKLHATIYDFLVACILMHDQATHRTK